MLDNVYTTSQQDTIYAGSISASGPYAARQYWFRGKVTGDALANHVAGSRHA